MKKSVIFISILTFVTPSGIVAMQSQQQPQSWASWAYDKTVKWLYKAPQAKQDISQNKQDMLEKINAHIEKLSYLLDKSEAKIEELTSKIAREKEILKEEILKYKSGIGASIDEQMSQSDRKKMLKIPNIKKIFTELVINKKKLIEEKKRYARIFCSKIKFETISKQLTQSKAPQLSPGPSLEVPALAPTLSPDLTPEQQKLETDWATEKETSERISQILKPTETETKEDEQMITDFAAEQGLAVPESKADLSVEQELEELEANISEKI